MTVTEQTSSTPQMPDWLHIDGAIPEDLRAEILDQIGRVGRPYTVWFAFELDEIPVVRQHLTHLKHRNLRPNYITSRLAVLSRVRRFTKRPLLEVSADELGAWLNEMLAHLKPESRAGELSHARMFYQWALDEELIERDPTRRLVRPKSRRRLPRPMPDADVTRALTESPPTVRLILHLAAFAGLRASEVSGLEREDFMMTADPPVLIVRDGKGGKQRVVPLNAELLSVLRSSNLATTGPLFLRADGTGVISRSRVCQLANTWLRDNGIEHSLHTLRHFFGTKVYAATHDLRLTQELMGHSSPNTTAGYTQWSPEKGAAAVEFLRVPS